jgi:hypothetical protein
MNREAKNIAETTEIIFTWMRFAHRLSPNYRFSFAFEQVINELKNRIGQPIPIAERDIIIENVRRKCAEKYHGGDKSLVAFSRDSFKGALYWLSDLDPSAVNFATKEPIFTLRSTCQPIGILYALRFILTERGDLKLSEDELLHEIVDRLILLNPERAKEAMRECFYRYPNLVGRIGSEFRLEEKF